MCWSNECPVDLVHGLVKSFPRMLPVMNISWKFLLSVTSTRSVPLVGACIDIFCVALCPCGADCAGFVSVRMRVLYAFLFLICCLLPGTLLGAGTNYLSSVCGIIM